MTRQVEAHCGENRRTLNPKPYKPLTGGMCRNWVKGRGARMLVYDYTALPTSTAKAEAYLGA